jgi:hypothetical protein
MTVAQAKSLGENATSIPNLYQQGAVIAKALASFNSGGMWNGSVEMIKNLGAPLVRVREYESSPGLWVLDDTESGITFLIWSDGYKKNPWKGTTVEVLVTRNNIQHFPSAVNKLKERLQ